ncbi:DUF2213 domain-containing protein [Candidatus Pacearchaeota archaeon]|nr:DUF2213 domain-containing protein [Candidatus Pacearchaeota archaeon]
MPHILKNVEHNDEAQLIHGLCRVDFTGRQVGNIVRTTEGYLTGQAPIAKIGIMTYILNDGSTRRELVNEDTLFNPDSMHTLHMKPVTDTHPPERSLDSRTVKRRKVGMTGETVKRDGEFLTTSLIITDQDAITSVDSGRKELSPGYRCDLLLEPGEFNGECYDGIQLNRQYNHLATCDKARGGSDLKLHLDNVDHLDGFEVNEKYSSDTKESQPIKRKGGSMPQINIDGISYEAAQEVINANNKAVARADEAEGKLSVSEAKVTDLQTKHDTLEGERDGLKTKVDELEKVDHTDAINTGITERLQVLDAVDAVITEDKRKELKLDDMSIKDLKIEVIRAKSPDVKLDDRTDEYIDARFDTIVENLDFDPDAVGKARKKMVQKSDSPPDEIEKARKDSEEKLQNSYKDLGGTVKVA